MAGVPLGRMGSPDEIERAALFLANKHRGCYFVGSLSFAATLRALKELGSRILLLGQGDRLHEGVAIGALDLPEVRFRRLDSHR